MENTNKNISAAKKVLEEISNDERERYLAELREKYIMDQKAIEDAGFDKGFDKGMEVGRKAGMKAGIEQEKANTVKRMKKQKIDIETISIITGLTVEQIENLE